MTDREVLEWWDYLSCKSFVFGPVRDIAALDEILNWHPRPVRPLSFD